MNKSNWFGRITALLMAMAVAFSTIIAVNGEGITAMGSDVEYGEKLFGDNIIELDILIDEADWQEMLDNATAEEYYTCDLNVNGQVFGTVGIRTKGNSSLSQVASNPDSDRYSFKFNFGKYIDGQTCFGLDSFVINNNISDATAMKDYISYDIMEYIGVDAPMRQYAKVSVNGEYWGLYLAVECYNSSFVARTYGVNNGNLYNVKTMEMGGNRGGENRPERPEQTGENGRGNFTPPEIIEENSDSNGTEKMSFQNIEPPTQPPDGALPENGGMQGGRGFGGADRQMPPEGELPTGEPPEMPAGEAMPQANNANEPTAETKQAPQGLNITAGQEEKQEESDTELNAEEIRAQPEPNENFTPPAMGNMQGGRGFGNDRGGGSLKYTDDDPDNYSAIFGNAVFGRSDEDDYARVIAAIKALNEGRDLEEYLDVDQILRYLAAHTVVVNLDSYSSNMQQNYYIYENEGKITILPWDYNLAFGSFQGGDLTSTINFPIDTPVSGVSMEDRPLISVLLAQEEYLDKYHEYLQEIVTGYFNSGRFINTVDRIDTLISAYLQTDPTAFYTYEQYEKAVYSFEILGTLRAESIQGQLNGTIPSTTEGQQADSSSLITTTEISISDLGSQGGGRMGGGEFGQMPERQWAGGENTTAMPPQWKENGERQPMAAQISGESAVSGSFVALYAVPVVIMLVLTIVLFRTKKNY